MAAGEGVGQKPGVGSGALRTVGTASGRTLVLNMAGVGTANIPLYVLGVFFETLALAVVEDAQTCEHIMRERATVGLGLQLVARPAFAANCSSIKLLEAVDQPGLLLFEHLDISDASCQVSRTHIIYG